MPRRLRHILPALLMAAAVAACNTSGCNDNRSSLLLAGFYSSASQKAVRVHDVEIGGVGAPADSLLVEASESVSEVYLPLRHTATSTSFFIRPAEATVADTITLGYTSEPYFASEECGAMYRYRLRSVEHTRHRIDSVGVLDSLINNVDMQKMRIFIITDEL